MEDFVFVFYQAIIGVDLAVMGPAHLLMIQMQLVKHMMIVIAGVETHVNVTANFLIGYDLKQIHVLKKEDTPVCFIII